MVTNSFETARTNMVDGQLRPNRLTDDRLQDAIERVLREDFVPKAMRGVAYMDEDIRVAEGRYLMEPVTFARLVQAADITEADSVLDVACATGYSTAVLSYLAGTVVGVEEDENLAKAAQDNLTTAEIANADVVQGSHKGGYAKQAPYTAIFVQGAVNEVPQALFDQLDEGGRLMAITRTGLVGHVHIYAKVKGYISDKVLFEASVPVLPGFETKTGFTF